MMGLKLAKTAYSLGSKLALLHSLGNKYSKMSSKSSSNHNKASSVSPDSSVGVNNMIYNKSNISDIQYLPFGVRKLTNEPKKKSYLEKR